MVDFTSAGGRALVARTGRSGVFALGVEGIKADDGEGYYFPPDARLADGRARRRGGLGARRPLPRATAARARRGPSRARGAVRALGLDRPAGDRAALGRRPGLGLLVAAGAGRLAVSGAASGFSNWSHDVGGYLGHRLVERCPPELLVRWVQFGGFTPLMQAHGRFQQEPWTYDGARARPLPRLRAAARAARPLHPRGGGDRGAHRPADHPAAVPDRPGGPRAAGRSRDAYGFGPSLWVAPVLDDGARERRAYLPRGEWIDWWTGERLAGGRWIDADAPARAHPGLGPRRLAPRHLPRRPRRARPGRRDPCRRPLEATLWGEPPLGHVAPGSPTAPGSAGATASGRSRRTGRSPSSGPTRTSRDCARSGDAGTFGARRPVLQAP